MGSRANPPHLYPIEKSINNRIMLHAVSIFDTIIGNTRRSLPVCATITRGAMATKEEKKVVIVGGGGYYEGKTCLTIVFSEGRFPAERNGEIPFENYVADIEFEGKPVELALYDVSGISAFDHLRHLCYPDTDVVLICYDVMNPWSLELAEENWVPEVRHGCPGVPFILVGCKSDLRTDPKAVAYVSNICLFSHDHLI